ncbi:MAG: hypothetical protein ABI603_14330 [Acidobacteriota bacterium]
MGDGENQDPLEACRETVHRLEEENDQLRQSAGAFGQLAERLNQTLREKRRLGSERRQAPRPSTERRKAAPSQPT